MDSSSGPGPPDDQHSPATSDHRLPEPPVISVAALRQILNALPDEWHVSTEDARHMLVFDAEMNPRGFIDVAREQTHLLEHPPIDEPDA